MNAFPHGLMFHRMHADGARARGQGSISATGFEQILLQVGIANILTPAVWQERLRDGRLRAQDRCLTFDDGLRSQYDVALPVMRKYGLLAFWFVYSSVFEGGLGAFEIYNCFGTMCFARMDDFHLAFLAQCPADVIRGLDSPAYRQYADTTKRMFPFYTDNDLRFRFARNDLLSREAFARIMDRLIESQGTSVAAIGKGMWMEDQHLSELSGAGHALGLHSYDHPYQLGRLPPAEQREQYTCNLAHLQRVSGKAITSMSHPVNSYGTDTLEILADLGIACGFRSNLTAPGGDRVNPNSLELAREDAVNIKPVAGR